MSARNQNPQTQCINIYSEGARIAGVQSCLKLWYFGLYGVSNIMFQNLQTGDGNRVNHAGKQAAGDCKCIRIYSDGASIAEGQAYSLRLRSCP